MAAQSQSRFTAQNKTTHERLSTNTVGLVALSDFRKRRAEILEQQEKEAREAAVTPGSNTPDRSQTATPIIGGEPSETEGSTQKKKKRQKKKIGGNKLSFGDADEDESGGDERDGTRPSAPEPLSKRKDLADKEIPDSSASEAEPSGSDRPGKLAANSTVGVRPRIITKAALRREAAEREALRKEFLLLQAAVRASEIAIPFVFYDGTNVPGGVVRVKKGDFIWVFLDKSRKVGANLGVGGDKTANVRREWARVGVDDLLLVRGTIIIPHHYDFYFFIINKNVGPGGRRLFDYSAERAPSPNVVGLHDSPTAPPTVGLRSSGAVKEALPDPSTLEGAQDDPAFTKVVDRRWYERNKHIYPASAWQEFDPEKNYEGEIRRDIGGNAFFFSK